MIWAKALAVFVVIALTETLHGILRVKFLNRPLGDRRARQVAIFTGSILILLIAWVAVPWLGVRTEGEALAVGLLWMLLMSAFDLAIGRLAFHFPWPRIFREFDPRQGGLLVLGMLVLLFAPLIVARLRSLL
jgi:hypothetical protein